MDFGQMGVVLRLGEVRSFIRKPYKHCYMKINIKIKAKRLKEK